MVDKYIIVDIDETLVYSRSRIADSINIGGDYEGEPTCPRPGAHQFLQMAKAEGWRIISLTQGVVPFQREVLRACGLLDYFEEIYGWETTRRVSATRPKFEEDAKWVMVDNLHHFELDEKAMWLDIHEFEPSVNFIKCQEYRGYHDDTHCLTTLIPAIKAMLDDSTDSTV